MKVSPSHAPQLILGACALVTAGLLLWPAGTASAPLPGAAAPYRGPVRQLREVAPNPEFPLRLAGAGGATAPAADVQPVPVLVGIAGSAAYLRSAATGATERVSRGGVLDGWTLRAVGARTVTLTGPGGDRRLELFAAGPDAAGPAAAPLLSEPPGSPAPSA